MFHFSKKMMYTIEAVLEIAKAGDSKPIRSKHIAKVHDIPERYLEQVMQRLVRAKILIGVRGPRGGYILGRSAEDISVADIVDIVRKLDQTEEKRKKKIPATTGAASLIPVLEEFNKEIMIKLGNIPLVNLFGQANNNDESALESKLAG
jgi:Rrf2 family protein